MNVGDVVMFETDVLKGRPGETGLVVAKNPRDGIFAASVDILWGHGELSERVPPRVLAVVWTLESAQ
jgi:hypothetical protein